MAGRAQCSWVYLLPNLDLSEAVSPTGKYSSSLTFDEPSHSASLTHAESPGAQSRKGEGVGMVLGLQHICWIKTPQSSLAAPRLGTGPAPPPPCSGAEPLEAAFVQVWCVLQAPVSVTTS